MVVAAARRFAARLPGTGRGFGHLEGDVATVPNDLCAGLDQMLARGDQQPVLDLLRQGQFRLWVRSGCAGDPAPRSAVGCNAYMIR